MKPGAAVVGLGVGEAHARTYASLGCPLWLHDHDRERAVRLAAELNAQVAESYQQILDSVEVRIVSVASYDQDHFRQTVAALDAGKHVFCEKPLCRSLDELRAVKRAWQRTAGQLASNLVLRAHPLYQWQDYEFGSLYAIDGDYLYGRLRKITEGWRAATDGYSVMLGGGIHLADQMLLLAGERPLTVSAQGSKIVTRYTAFRYRDYITATYTFGSGLVGRISANFGAAHPHQHVLRAFGTQGTFLHDDSGARFYRGSGRPEHLGGFAPSKAALIPAFVLEVVSGANADPQHEFDLISVCVAADASVDRQRPVRIEYV